MKALRKVSNFQLHCIFKGHIAISIFIVTVHPYSHILSESVPKVIWWLGLVLTGRRAGKSRDIEEVVVQWGLLEILVLH